ncbi:MAG: hypothetical protein AB2793_17150 [Candidatus Thiodiazotropha sp.]
MNASRHAERLGGREMAATLSRAILQEVLCNSDDAVVFYDLDRLDDRLNALKNAFPANTLHAVAVKANPVVEVLKRIHAAGCGAEVASLGELQLTLAAGFPVDAIVFDSPVKTIEEIRLALKLGVGINANTLHELDRIADILSTDKSRSRIGVRLNPETGLGSIDATSVAVQYSKFGVSLRECHDALERAFSAYSWLTGIHVHIGSQGMSRDQLLDGIGAAYDFFIEFQQTGGILTFNIGGGLPAKYRDSDEPMGFNDYASALQERCPELFKAGVSLVTEFGRSVQASCGWVAARIEYLVEYENALTTAFIHVGADMFLRKAYRPEDWHHDITVCDSNGRQRQGPVKLFRVAGPLCFAGDYLEKDVFLPANTREGDYILLHDAGAYTFSMWSTYNSRQFPAVIGYGENQYSFQTLKPRQSTEDLVAFWSTKG